MKTNLIDKSGAGLVRIEGKTAGAMLGAEGLTSGAGQEIEGGMLYSIRQDLFFVHTEAGEETAVVANLSAQAEKQDDLITITNVTNAHSDFVLIGSQSHEVLSCLCSLDFHDTQFPNSTAKISSVAKTRQLIIRQDVNGVPAYHLLGGRSFADYLWQTIIKAGQGVGLGIV